MKKCFIISIFILLCMSINVFAMDTLYSINKYNNEELEFIKYSYNTDGNVDGIISTGTFLKKKIEKGEVDFYDYQVMLIKYSKSGKVKWKLDYGKTGEDEVYDLTYTYDEDGNINGYLVLMNKSYDIEETSKLYRPLLLKVDLDGKLIEEVEIINDGEYILDRIVPVFRDKKFTNYMLSGYKITSDNNIGVFYSLGRELNINYNREYREDGFVNSKIFDITYVNKDTDSLGYVGLVNFEDSEFNHMTKLIRFDNDGNYVSTIKEDFDEVDSPKLSYSDNGFVLYGLTSEVKLKNNKTVSYYLEKYDGDFNKEWETIGDSYSKEANSLVLNPIYDSYLLMYKNSDDSSIEIVKINNEGLIKEKVKKINNEYYKINSFISRKDVLYFVGNISCPEYDNCGYETNSLFLVSTEDKVIEVKADDNFNVIAISILIVVLLGFLFILRKYNENKKENM